MSAAAISKTKLFFASASKRIQYGLEHHPVASNSILCLNLWVVGDFVAQFSEHKQLRHDVTTTTKSENIDDPALTNRKQQEFVGGGERSHSSSSSSPLDISFWEDQLDLLRTAQCASYGAFVTGPILALWYPYLDRVCLKYNLALRFGAWGAPIAKVAADEFIMEPPSLVLFFGYMNVCEGGTWDAFTSKVKTQFFPSWYTSLAIWPAVLLGTFRFLPVHVHAPVINVCCIAWDAFLSHRNAMAKNANKIKNSDHENNKEETQEYQDPYNTNKGKEKIKLHSG